MTGAGPTCKRPSGELSIKRPSHTPTPISKHPGDRPLYFEKALYCLLPGASPPGEGQQGPGSPLFKSAGARAGPPTRIARSHRHLIAKFAKYLSVRSNRFKPMFFVFFGACNEIAIYLVTICTERTTSIMIDRSFLSSSYPFKWVAFRSFVLILQTFTYTERLQMLV